MDGEGSTSKHEARPVETVDLSDGDDGTSETARNPWTAGVWARFPFLPFAGILATVLSAVACVVVLVWSNGANIKNWQVRPSVLLGIFTAVGKSVAGRVYDRKGAWLYHE
ncbi:hypothetical protein B0T22DRAFT_442350 [Podospora appendiculata]|uniref:Uncharacterized protein n=1 Tax=Podospora appendiculata TaxID=314037 RepID=A0AAE1CA50_9PEZI|nr:hypothetical protein B0T22DRAFT_442350 [Podospora appendiculata]